MKQIVKRSYKTSTLFDLLAGQQYTESIKEAAALSGFKGSCFTFQNLGPAMKDARSALAQQSPNFVMAAAPNAMFAHSLGYFGIPNSGRLYLEARNEVIRTFGETIEMKIY